jgi:hypothetical protein
MYLAWIVLFPFLLDAGVIQGIVLEHASGLPLARSRVRLDSVTATGVTAYASLLSARTGGFMFYNIPDGLYILTAHRDTYFPAGYGQRRAEGPGGRLPAHFSGSTAR